MKMVSKLNSTIGKIYEKSSSGIKQVLETPIKVKPMKTKNISLVKSTTSVFSKWLTGLKEFYHNHSADFKYLLLAIPIIATFLIVREVQRYQSLRSRAVTPQISVYFEPSSSFLPPEGSFDLWMNSSSSVGFSDIEITFDRSLVKLTGEIATYQSLSRIVKVSSMAEANSTGRISIILGLDPSQRNTPPTGTFRVATLKLNANTVNNLATTVNFDNSAMLVVSMDQSVFTTTTTGLNLNLNPTPTPQSTQPPIITPTPSGTQDTTPPTITIKNPQAGYTLPAKGLIKVTTAATDASGIYSIKIYIDEVLKKTCSNATSCVYSWNVRSVTAGTHVIRADAVDKSPNRNPASTSINVNK